MAVKKAPNQKLQIKGPGTSLLYVVSYGEGKVTGRNRNQEKCPQREAQRGTKSHLVIRGQHYIPHLIPRHSKSDRHKDRAKYTALQTAGRWSRGHRSTLSICDAETAVGRARGKKPIREHQCKCERLVRSVLLSPKELV